MITSGIPSEIPAVVWGHTWFMRTPLENIPPKSVCIITITTAGTAASILPSSASIVVNKKMNDSEWNKDVYQSIMIMDKQNIHSRNMNITFSHPIALDKIFSSNEEKPPSPPSPSKDVTKLSSQMEILSTMDLEFVITKKYVAMDFRKTVESFVLSRSPSTSSLSSHLSFSRKEDSNS
jgi:hypothetical protein